MDHPCEDKLPMLELRFSVLLPSDDVRTMLTRWYVLLQLWALYRCRHG